MQYLTLSSLRLLLIFIFNNSQDYEELISSEPKKPKKFEEEVKPVKVPEPGQPSPGQLTADKVRNPFIKIQCFTYISNISRTKMTGKYNTEIIFFFFYRSKKCLGMPKK